MAQRYDVSVIIVNWNRVDALQEALHYLRFQRGVRFEVLVIDNGSTDGSAERLSGMPSIRWIGLESNVGPAQARNIGIANARGRYLFFLDSDAVVAKSGLARLVARMDRDPTIGIVACRVIGCPSRRTDQWIYQYPRATHEHREFDTYSFSAAGAMVRSEAIRDAGRFWDALFIYNEEVDLSIRVLRAGFRVIYSPKVRVYHRPCTSGRMPAATYWHLQVRNWIWISYRYYSTLPRMRNILLHVGGYLIKGLVNGQLRACLSGILAGLVRTDIIRRFPDKLTREEQRLIRSLSRRYTLRLGRD
jgi:GT2 family glycosyltransferase